VLTAAGNSGFFSQQHFATEVLSGPGQEAMKTSLKLSTLLAFPYIRTPEREA